MVVAGPSSDTGVLTIATCLLDRSRRGCSVDTLILSVA